MRLATLILLIGVPLLGAEVVALENQFLGVKPGESTSSSIREVFGKPQHDLEDIKLVHVKGLRVMAYSNKNEQFSFYLKDDKVVFINVVPKEADELPTSLKGFHLALGKPEAVWASAHGAGYDVVVYAKAGIAVHVRGDAVQVVELFQPTDTKGYKARFYKNPAPRHRTRIKTD